MAAALPAHYLGIHSCFVDQFYTAPLPFTVQPHKVDRRCVNCLLGSFKLSTNKFNVQLRALPAAANLINCTTRDSSNDLNTILPPLLYILPFLRTYVTRLLACCARSRQSVT
jgi:hypothetical protein